jgi:lipopolysaccharide transport system permease protein
MSRYPASPREIAASFWRNRALVAMLAQREALGRYRGSALGIAWSFFHPLLMLTVYTFVFSGVFKARWTAADGTTGSGSTAEYALVLFAGLLMYTLFAECLTRAPALILSNVNYVKKVAFPLEILPWVGFGAALFHFAVGFVVWLIFYGVVFGAPPVTALLLPVMMLPLVLTILGLAWLLAALGVYLRDVGQIVGIVTAALIFLSPIFYPLSALPDSIRPFLFLNPLTPAVELARDVLIWGKLPDWNLYGTFLAIAAVIAALGFAFFQKTRKGFADVI